jgi:S-adenosylmethionine/arginine decarboxylase-like enzyme
MRDAAAATKQQDTKKIKSYEMTVPKKTAPLILLSSFILAFNLGRVSRSFLIAPGAPTFSEDRLKLLGKLPVPTLKEGIKITDSRIYNTSKSSQWIIAEETACVAEKQESREADVDEETVDEEDFEDEEGLSKGQQLMLDFKYVSKKFLDSAERLTKAMIEVLKENDLDLLSYHCYKLEPEGINCQFALLKGRVSFTTWPRNGVMAMDIFLLSSSDEDKKLSISIMPSFEKTFSIAENRKKPADMYWILKQRGFNEGDSSEGDILASSDMDHWPLASACTYKKHVRVRFQPTSI